MLLNLNFKKLKAAQDIICIIENEKGLTTEEAIIIAINDENWKNIFTTGWSDIAYSLWGHASERVWVKMKSPKMELHLEDGQYDMLEFIVRIFDISFEDAICRLLIFEVEKLGYHI